jgi:hypothetical protein
MTQTHSKFSFWRFSLRTLLLAVTAICVFSAYQVHWCNQRRDYMLQWPFPGWPANRQLFPAVSRRTIEMNSVSFSDRGAPYLLWLFGERRAEAIWLRVGIKDVTRTGGETATIRRSHPALKRAKSLFPEARVWTVVCEEIPQLEIEIVD